MRAVVSVVGKDRVGILAAVSNICANTNANVMEVTQSILQDFFVMMMVIDISQMNCGLGDLRQRLEEQCEGMKIHVMHEDIFNSMHRI
jgi:ACT domain-containing protein